MLASSWARSLWTGTTISTSGAVRVGRAGTGSDSTASIGSSSSALTPGTRPRRSRRAARPAVRGTRPVVRTARPVGAAAARPHRRRTRRVHQRAALQDPGGAPLGDFPAARGGGRGDDTAGAGAAAQQHVPDLAPADVL